MLRISKMTDYGTLILAELANGAAEPRSATDIAASTGLGAPTASKLLKSLARAGLVTSQRGSRGGYVLAKPADAITAVAIIDAIEGPVALTACASNDTQCELEHVCGVGSSWQQISASIRAGLAAISLDDMRRNRNLPAEMPLRPMYGAANTESRAHLLPRDQ
ncbi:MAG: SUF system Fe-S cluster assembly regulator [Pseudomonadota bacterium]